MIILISILIVWLFDCCLNGYIIFLDLLRNNIKKLFLMVIDRVKRECMDNWGFVVLFMVFIGGFFIDV